VVVTIDDMKDGGCGDSSLDCVWRFLKRRCVVTSADKWLSTKADVTRQIGPKTPFLPQERDRPALYCLVRSVDGDSWYGSSQIMTGSAEDSPIGIDNMAISKTGNQSQTAQRENYARRRGTRPDEVIQSQGLNFSCYRSSWVGLS
jgi:hypothetical protein